jgi:hypothetical protein
MISASPHALQTVASLSVGTAKRHNGGVDAAARIKSAIGNWKSAMTSRSRRSRPTICWWLSPKREVGEELALRN